MPPQKAPLKYAAAIRPMHAGVPAALPNSARDPPSPVPKSSKQETGSTQLRVPTRRRFRLKPLHCPLPLIPTRRALKTPRLHRTTRRREHGSVTAPSSSAPNTGKQDTGSTELGEPTRRRFRLKPLHCPLPLLPTCHPPKTPLLHQNESSSGAR
jgi:hypothetical protein